MGVTVACSISECGRKVNTRGWCAAHYQRWKKYGDPLAGPPFRKPRGAPRPACAVAECERDAITSGWCDMHYRRWRATGDPGQAAPRSEGPRSSNYPADDELVALMAAKRTYPAVATALGVSRESLKDYLSRRPALKARLEEHRVPRLTPEQVLASKRRSGREWQRKYRAQNPEEALRRRREHMATYGPEYRQRWNHYNRLRRLELATPDAAANEYALILRGDPCSYCGQPMKHVDHIVPIALGGTGRWDNLTAACAGCNFRKGDRPLLVFMLASLDLVEVQRRR